MNTQSQKEYSSYLKEIFKTIKDNISRNNQFYNEIENSLSNIEEQIDKDFTFNADVYFPLISKSLVYENYKIAESVLKYSKLLIEHNFLLGNSNDFPLLHLNQEDIQNRKMIDTIIDTFINIDNYKSEHLLILISDVLNEMIINKHIDIHGKRLIKIYKFYINIYPKLKQKDNITSIEVKFWVLTESIFNKVKDDIPNDNFNLFQNDESTCFTNKQTITNYNTSSSTNFTYTNNEISDIVRRIVIEMVDNVCLLNIDTNNTNENGESAGLHGWCFVCRKTANLYCTHYKKGICSEICKFALLELFNNNEENISNTHNDIATHLYEYYNEDAETFIKYLCQTLTNDSVINKLKGFLLVIVINIIENGNKIFFSYRPSILTQHISEMMILNLLNDDIVIFENSLALFGSLFINMREYLKSTISIVNNNILLKLLMNKHIDIERRTKILNFYSEKAMQFFFIEMYSNYDCQVYEINIVDKIFNALNKIIQTKCEDEDDSDENFLLKKEAVNTLSKIIECIKQYCENENNTKDEIDNNQNKEKLICEKIQKKQKIQKLIEIFNKNTKKGIKLLLSEEYKEFINNSNTEETSKSISRFLMYTPGLKKENIGEYLGENDSLSLKVLSHYANIFNYKDKHILSALRIFLSSFLLPGESQKIDRILEQFSIKYHKDNPSILTSSDQVYFLSYSIMILQTSIHNPNVKDKLTYEQFAQMHKSSNISSIYLKDIYEQIQQNPFSLPEFENVNNNNENVFHQEKKQIINEALIKLYNFSPYSTPYHIPFYNHFYIKHFINNFWSIVYAMFSVVIRFSENEILLNKSINGMVHCVKITHVLNLESAKEILVSDLSAISDFVYVKELSMKSVLRIKAILELANEDNCYFYKNWENVLHIIDIVCLYHLYKKGNKQEKEKIVSYLKEKNKENNLLNIELNNIELITQHVKSEEYDNIKLKTEKFSTKCFNDFIKTLCTFTNERFRIKAITKSFWFYMCVKVFDINIYRTCSNEWDDILSTLNEFIISIGLHGKVKIILEMIDSLKQFIKKYLTCIQSGKAMNCYQKKFFTPLFEIWNKHTNHSIKEMIIQSLMDIIHNHCKEINEGWEIVLKICSTISHSENKSNYISSTTLYTLYEKRKDLLFQTTNYFFELVDCFKQFAEDFPQEVLSIYEIFTSEIITLKHLTSLSFGFYHIININQNNQSNILDSATEKLINCISISLPKITIDKNLPIFFDKLYMQVIIPLMNILSKKGTISIQILLNEATKWFDQYFNFNYKFIEYFFDALSYNLCSDINEKELSNHIINCIKSILQFQKLNNIILLKNYIDLNIGLLIKNIPNELEHISLLDKNKLLKAVNVSQHKISILNRLLSEIIGPLINQFILVFEMKDIDNMFNAFNKLFTNCSSLMCSFEKMHFICKECNIVINMNEIQYNTIVYLFKIMIKRNDDNKYKYEVLIKMKDVLKWFCLLDEQFEKNEFHHNEELQFRKQELQQMEYIILNEMLPRIKGCKFYDDTQNRTEIKNIVLSIINSKRYNIKKEVIETLEIITCNTENDTY